MKKTIVLHAEDGRQMLSITDSLTQVKVGADFYVGQVRYVVVEIRRDDDDDLRIYINVPGRS